MIVMIKRFAHGSSLMSIQVVRHKYNPPTLAINVPMQLETHLADSVLNFSAAWYDVWPRNLDLGRIRQPNRRMRALTTSLVSRRQQMPCMGLQSRKASSGMLVIEAPPYYHAAVCCHKPTISCPECL